MNDLMREYFRQSLLRWKDELLRDADATLQHLQEDTEKAADVADRASVETDRTIELRTRDRARKLINKIDDALGRIEDGSYGFCEETHRKSHWAGWSDWGRCIYQCVFRTQRSKNRRSTEQCFCEASGDAEGQQHLEVSDVGTLVGHRGFF